MVKMTIPTHLPVPDNVKIGDVFKLKRAMKYGDHEFNKGTKATYKGTEILNVGSRYSRYTMDYPIFMIGDDLKERVLDFKDVRKCIEHHKKVNAADFRRLDPEL